ncbi:hypothetical protein HPB49_025368 [Dermacentor silvarum]|uniref:Uncharacterized protein n=1 Tax=Dermacentor silvarum TaxID=543639 RepID=A0ACB8D1G3_DERSI|nr:hypothetical protein HPB49_025368 [Dermacentor silvarum]
MLQPVYPQTLPVQGASIPPGQPILRPLLCHPFVAPLEEEVIAYNGEPSEQAMSSRLNPSAAAYEPRSTSIQASAVQDEYEFTQGTVGPEFADNQTQVAPEMMSKGTSTVDLTADIPQGFATRVRSLLEEYPTGLDIEVLMKMCEKIMGSSAYFKQNKHPLEMLPDILSSVSSVCIMPDSGGRFKVMLYKSDQKEKQNDAPALPDDLRCGLLSILLKIPQGLKVSELLDLYERRFGEVFSPSEFYILITEDGALSRLTDLMTELDAFYSSAPADFYSVSFTNLKPGFVCAALYTNNGQPLWHRAVVQSVRLHEVFVSYIDYGTIMPVKVADIRRLRSDFLELPAQAIRASLAGVKPKKRTGVAI